MSERWKMSETDALYPKHQPIAVKTPCQSIEEIFQQLQTQISN